MLSFCMLRASISKWSLHLTVLHQDNGTTFTVHDGAPTTIPIISHHSAITNLTLLAASEAEAPMINSAMPTATFSHVPFGLLLYPRQDAILLKILPDASISHPLKSQVL